MMELRCGKCKRMILNHNDSGFQNGYFVEPCTKCTLELQPMIQRLAVVMDAQFRANEGDKSGWDVLTNQKCFVRIREELEELLDAYVNQLDPAVVMREAADVGLFLCFLAENYKRRHGK